MGQPRSSMKGSEGCCLLAVSYRTTWWYQWNLLRLLKPSPMHPRRAYFYNCMIFLCNVNSFQKRAFYRPQVICTVYIHQASHWTCLRCECRALLLPCALHALTLQPATILRHTGARASLTCFLRRLTSCRHSSSSQCASRYSCTFSLM